MGKKHCVFPLTLCMLLAVLVTCDIQIDDVIVVPGQNVNVQIGDEKFLTHYKVEKIMLRDQKSIPSWLHYDSNSSQLTGQPNNDDVGIYVIKLSIKCIDLSPAMMGCQRKKFVKQFQITVVEPLRSSESREVQDGPPLLYKSIDHLDVVIGDYFEYLIPESTFIDTEDGSTRNLSLSVSLKYGKLLPADGWLMFNSTSQTLYGLPLPSDIVENDDKAVNHAIVTATDSRGQCTKEAVTFTFKLKRDVTHQVIMVFNQSYEQFVTSRTNLIEIAQYIASFFGDKSLEFLTFSQTQKGSTIVKWSNNSLFGTVCYLDMIREMYGEIIEANSSGMSHRFELHFLKLAPLSASLEYLGACLLPPTTSKTDTISSLTESQKDRKWIEIVLPAVITILGIVIIAVILLVCCRHRHSSKKKHDSQKPSFLEDRRPIIFPEELEMVDSSLKCKAPLILPADSDYLRETPPAVPPHGANSPPFRDQLNMHADDNINIPVSSDHGTSPPPYRLPPPYFNPHRHS